jgi:hypothetical protein
MRPSNPRRPGPSPASRPPRPGPARETIEIPKVWLALLAGGLLLALLVVAYLVGRESGRRATGAATLDPPAAAPMGGETSELAPLTPAPADRVYPDPVQPGAPWPLEADPPAAGPQAPGWPGVAEPPAAADPQAAAVAAYFAQLEGHERQAKYWSNPQELAMTLIGEGAQGDTSGFDKLLEAHRAAERQIAAMSVPYPCQEHHRRTLAVLGQALALLEKLQGGVMSGDLEGLVLLSGESRELEAETRAIDALAEQLKRQFGV